MPTISRVHEGTGSRYVEFTDPTLESNGFAVGLIVEQIIYHSQKVGAYNTNDMCLVHFASDPNEKKARYFDKYALHHAVQLSLIRASIGKMVIIGIGHRGRARILMQGSANGYSGPIINVSGTTLHRLNGEIFTKAQVSSVKSKKIVSVAHVN
jgi:hypothetical protein